MPLRTKPEFAENRALDLARTIRFLSFCVLLLTLLTDRRNQAQTNEPAPRFVVIPSAVETTEGNASVGFGSSGAQFVLQYLYRQADITG
jgi:hypothetical protein